MLCRAVAYLVKLYAFVHLLVETLSCSAVGWVECSVVAVCAASAADFSVAVRACESCVQDNLLQALSIFTFEISYKRIISFPVWESVIFKHGRISMSSTKTFHP